MGLCLSKKDVLIQQPQLSLREQMLSELGRESHDHFMMLDSPSTSMFSVDSSSVLVSSSEKQLLKTGSAGSSSMLRSSSNVAECGSVAEWRAEQASPDGSSSNSSSRIHDLQSEARTSGFSYLSSPMIQGIDAYGLDNIAKSYAEARQKSKDKFELDGGFGLGSKQHRKLLEIHKEEDEEEDERTEEEEENNEEDGDGCSREDVVPELRTTKKTTTRSLHVFGEVFGDRTPETKQSLVGFPSKLKSSCGVEPEIGVFGAERYFKRSDFDERVKLQQKNRHHLQKCGSLSESEVDSELARTRQQHQRWGFYLDSGSEEADEEDISSTTSTQVESLKSSSRKKASSAAFMAVPRSEMWPNFAHMNPSKRVASSSGDHHSSSSAFAKRKEFLGIHHEQQQQGANAEYRESFSTDDISSTTYATDSGDEFFRGSNSNTNSRGFLRGFAAMPLDGNLFKPSSHLRNPSAFGARSSSASSSLFEEDHKVQQKMHYFPKQKKRFDDYEAEDDDGSDSDNSNDLFEIETLEAALGSLSSSSDKEFVYPKNKAFLRDPDISYSTSMSSTRNHHHHHHQLPRAGGGGNNKPTLLRANVIVSSSKRRSEEHLQQQQQQQHQHRVESFRGLYHCRDIDPSKDPKKQSLLSDLENKNSLLYRGLGIYGR